MILLDKFLNNLLKFFLTSLIILVAVIIGYLFFDLQLKNSASIAQKTIIGKGSAQIKAIADIASFNFTIKKFNKDLKIAQQEMTQIANKAIEVLEKNNIAKTDIKTSGYSSFPEYERLQVECQKNYCPPYKMELKGYVVSQSYEVKIREIARASQIFGEFSAIGVEEVGGLNFIVDSIQKIKSQARIKAIENARQEAMATAKALGVKIKKIVKFYEDDNYYTPVAYRVSASRAMADSAPQNSEIMAGEEVVNSSVTITFEFE
ncbi:MAG: SIMPL domain-containing protein [Alphaproteobacteria bacterium]